jgi:hypothetical protein
MLIKLLNMKKVIIIAGITSLILGACTNTKLATYKDDVYASPSEERLERERIAAEKKKQQEEEARREQEELAAQKAKEDANPIYKTPDYNKDDYYDYEYASRIRRFNEPVYGLGYYDNYYTNYYWYNGNPACYGTSIYNSYNWWGPSYGCNPYGNGVSVSFNYGYGNPYGYPYGNPYGYGWNNPYNSYWNGYYNGYNNGYFNGMYGYPYGYNYGYPNYGGGWGYYNSFDVNSGYKNVTYAPRTSHDGGNASRTSRPGMKVDENGHAMKYMQNVQTAQENTPKFDPKLRSVNRVKSGSGGVTPVNSTGGNIQNNSNNPRTVTGDPSDGNKPRFNKANNSNNNNQVENGPVLVKPGQIKTESPSEPLPGRNNNQQPIKVDKPNRMQNSPQQEVKPDFNNSPSNQPSNQSPSNSPRESNSPRNTGGRPR